MQCKEFHFDASGYVDGQLSQDETAKYHTHLVGCADCQDYVRQLDRVGELLRTVEPVDLPSELHGNVMLAVRSNVRDVTSLAGVKRRLVESVQRFNPQVISYSAGAIVSGLLFALTLAGFKPIPTTGYIPYRPVIAVTGTDEQFDVYNDLSDLDHPTGEKHAYELPRVTGSSSLVNFSNVAYRKPGNEGAAALVEVMPDGSGRLVRVLEEPSDPTVIDKLRRSLSEKPFQPAILSGKPVPTRIVLFLQKMDVIG